MTNEPEYDKTSKITCTHEVSDQPAQQLSNSFSQTSAVQADLSVCVAHMML